MASLMCLALAKPSYDTIINAYEECSALYSGCWRVIVSTTNKLLKQYGVKPVEENITARELLDTLASRLEEKLRKEKPTAPKSTIAEMASKETYRIAVIVLSVIIRKMGVSCAPI